MIRVHGFNPDEVYARYLEMRSYVGWQEHDTERLRTAGQYVTSHLAALVDDFYEEIRRHPQALAVITGGATQIERLKSTLRQWLEELFESNYDRAHVVRRWQVGWRHVEIGLRQVYVNAAMSRLHGGILRILRENWDSSPAALTAIEDAIGRAIDLDLATIQDAYEAEKHLRSESAFRNLVEAAGCAIVIFRPSQQIVYFNPHAVRLTGFAEAEIVGQPFIDQLLPADDRAAAVELFDQVFEGKSTVGFEQAVLCREEGRRLLVWNARRIENFAGGPAVLAVGHDVTELKSAQQRALQAERLAAIGQTMAGLAHESRNAFQRIQACLEMLALEVEDRPEAMNLVDRIQRAQKHLHQLYEEVRRYAAPINLERQKGDLSQAWREAWDQLAASQMCDSAELSEDVQCDAHCLFDLFAMTQVFRNVLENAIAACGASAHIEISVRETMFHDQRMIETVIADNGPGLPPDVAARVFEPFFTTKTKGTGLGLSIARRVIEAHQGTMSISNLPTGGAAVTIILPVRT